jgi:hypothetical protein
VTRKGAKGRCYPPFKPTEAQRALVKLLSGLMVNQDQIRLLVTNRHSSKPISKVTLHRYFKDELQTGNIALKALIAGIDVGRRRDVDRRRLVPR